MSKWISYYKAFAVISLNTTILFMIMWVLFQIVTLILRESPPLNMTSSGGENQNIIFRRYGINPYVAYPMFTKEEVDRLLLETWSGRQLILSPFVNFQERDYKGQFVNVQDGKRLTSTQWPPPSSSIFVFGGSTTFGYGVSDAQTIPAVMQKQLDTTVYNFGCGYYYSSQERALFEKLLIEGHIPAVAIFIDGLNDLIPAVTMSSMLGVETYEPPPTTNSYLNAIDRYQRNQKTIRAIAKEFGVRVIFAWQPVRAYQYKGDSDLFNTIQFKERTTVTEGYTIMNQLHDSGKVNVVWLADLHNRTKGPSYVDEVHYSPELCNDIAQCLVKFCKSEMER